MNRRTFLRVLGLGTVAVGAGSLLSTQPKVVKLNQNSTSGERASETHLVFNRTKGGVKVSKITAIYEWEFVREPGMQVASHIV